MERVVESLFAPEELLPEVSVSEDDSDDEEGAEEEEDTSESDWIHVSIISSRVWARDCYKGK